MKTVYSKWLLSALLMCGLCQSFTSCKDDDSSQESGVDATEVDGATTMDISDDDAILASLLRSWCGFVVEDAGKGLINNTYEPTVGAVAASTPTERTIIVGTLEAADAYAAQCLSVVGINPQSPAGFSWSQPALGSVAYSHGAGNELGVIEVNIRQIPLLKKIRLVKNPEQNVQPGGPAYYQKGDLVKYTGSGSLNGKYFICVNDHNANQEANWISFDVPRANNYGDLSIGTCNWSLTGKDSVFTQIHASAGTLLMWLKEFVLNDEQYDEVLSHIVQAKIPQRDIREIVPINDRERASLLRSIIRKPSEVVLDAWKSVGTSKNPNDMIQADAANWPKTVKRSTNSYEIYNYTPYGLLLCGAMRWSMGTTYNYWQPNLSLLKRHADTDALGVRVMDAESQTTLSPSHFQWFFFPNLHVNSRVLYANEIGDYDLHQTAVHWTHEPFKKPDDNKKYYALVDFTKVNSEIPLSWDNRNIASHELVIKDQGVKYKYFEDVYRRQANNAVLPDQDANTGENAFYCYGDVVRDEEDGSRWVCIRPSGEIVSNKTHALFVSFDGITTYNDQNRSANNIVKEKDVVEVAWYIMDYIERIELPDNEVHMIANNNTRTAKVNFGQFYVKRDSIVVVKNTNPTYAFCFNVAYDDGTTDRQPMMRCVFDGSYLLTADRVGDTDAYPRHRFYKHYQTFGPGIQWKDPWPIAQDKIFLDDVADPQKVAAYNNDKWAKLPGTGYYGRSGIRQQVDPRGANVDRYLWTDGKFGDATATGMYYEPVLFMRTMWLPDEHKHAKTSPDGHPLTLLAQMEKSYRDNLALFWYNLYRSKEMTKYNFLDNVTFEKMFELEH